MIMLQRSWVLYPSRTASTFSKNIGACIGDLVNIINEKGLSYGKMASGIFPAKELSTPEALEFGCDRDYDAYDQSNPCVVDKDSVPYGFRTAGGHVHIGHEVAKSYPEICILACDLYLGLPSILMDKDVQRWMLYGKASRYRIQPWGVEYRTLSNFWIFTDQYKQWVFKQVEKVVSAAELALRHKPVLDAQTEAIRAERGRLHAALAAIDGVTPFPSEANFILLRVPAGRARAIFEGLRTRGVLVKSLDGAHPLLADCLRVTVGTPDENAAFVAALRGVV